MSRLREGRSMGKLFLRGRDVGAPRATLGASIVGEVGLESFDEAPLDRALNLRRLDGSLEWRGSA
jgi:hypothetical protein